MRPITAILIGWFVVLTASLCSGQSYNASHVFRNRTVSRPTMTYRSDNIYRDVNSYRPPTFSEGSYYSGGYRSTYSAPSYYSRWLGATSRARTAASIDNPAGLDAARSLYRPGLGWSNYYDDHGAFGSDNFDWSADGYRHGGRYRRREYNRSSLSKYFGD